MNARIASSGILLLLGLSLPAVPFAAEESPDALEVLQKSERVFERLAGTVRPAVANIRRFTKDAAWWEKVRPERRGTAGWRVVPTTDLLHPGHRPGRGASGFLVSADGYIVTLRRVIVDPATGREAPIVDVEVGSDHFKADVMGLEPTLDLAVLKITSASPLPFLRFGDSGKSRPGHWAIAFGNPDGSEQTLMPGFVSFQPTRECYQDDLSATYLQTSAPVGDGSLGGPVVNLRGEVIGVSARLGRPGATGGTAPATGSGHALPSNIANAILQSLLIRENKESPWLGISVLALTEATRTRLGGHAAGGIEIDNVFDPSPASTAGILVGDILHSLAGEPIATVYDFQRLLYHHGPGSRVLLGIVRGGKPLEVAATIARRPPEATTR
jgi:serine protease Do